MPSYKDENSGTWYCKFYYVDWTGTRRQRLKRGFKLQREAKEWERIFLEQFAKNPDITFAALYEKYKSYITPRIRESTAHTRFHMMDRHILPFFKNRVISDISPADISAWQTEMMEKGLSDTYLRSANTYLKAVFAYAVDYVGLEKNPCRKPIGSTRTQNVDFWTPEEYALFIHECKDNIEYYTIFEILYYTGMRAGELLALTLNDIDLKKKQISINKTFYHLTGKDSIQPPKTAKGERTVDIPDFLADEIREYQKHLYKPDPEDRLFPKQLNYIRSAFNIRVKRAGVKKIRIHDLRHSHASTLIHLGANPVLVAERLGHESPDITLKTYSHLFPSSQTDIVQKISKVN